MATKYYAMIDGVQKGPFSLQQLPEAGVRPSTYIWCKGMQDWQKAEDDPEVCRLFRNHLYDKMHPSDAPQQTNIPVEDNRWKVQPDEPKGPLPSKFDRFLQQAGEDPLPTLEEIDSKEDKTNPPISMIGYAWLVTIFCFPPTGIAALVYAYKSKNAWKKGENNLAHDLNRKAKMLTGISFFIGIIGYGLFMALSM